MTEQIVWISTMVDAHKYCFVTDVQRNSSVCLRWAQCLWDLNAEVVIISEEDGTVEVFML